MNVFILKHILCLKYLLSNPILTLKCVIEYEFKYYNVFIFSSCPIPHLVLILCLFSLSLFTQCKGVTASLFYDDINCKEKILTINLHKYSEFTNLNIIFVPSLKYMNPVKYIQYE